uniref:Uncharacterized protein n=1 Tax=Trichuris muris TaxID=70415 RepID=A0A5S6QIH5_TRIMR
MPFSSFGPYIAGKRAIVNTKPRTIFHILIQLQTLFAMISSLFAIIKNLEHDAEATASFDEHGFICITQSNMSKQFSSINGKHHKKKGPLRAGSSGFEGNASVGTKLSWTDTPTRLQCIASCTPKPITPCGKATASDGPTLSQFIFAERRRLQRRQPAASLMATGDKAAWLG